MQYAGYAAQISASRIDAAVGNEQVARVRGVAEGGAALAVVGRAAEVDRRQRLDHLRALRS